MEDGDACVLEVTGVVRGVAAHGNDDGNGLLSGNADQDVEEGMVCKEAYAVGAGGEGFYLSELGLKVLNLVSVLG